MACVGEMLKILQAKNAEGSTDPYAELKPEEAMLSYENMMDIVFKLGFLPRTKVPENFEVDLTRDLWTLVKGEEL